jgi:choline dehydrogenase-like flavoprotein
MLSGIGPAEHLREHEIKVLADLPGVGRNLQDRYEVSVVYKKIDPKTKAPRPWKILEGAKFSTDDPQFMRWVCRRKGVYTTNGALAAVITRSSPSQPLPDLFCFALLADFRGYYTGYSTRIRDPHYLSWTILKAHTANRAGRVELKSRDPRCMPSINFHYFEEGDGPKDADADAVVDGICFVRDLAGGVSELQEELPGTGLEKREELREWVKDHAWGHHASCTCPIGPRDGGGVVDSKFRVHGTQGLRIVDASVFPKIPGFFIVSSVYVIAEKAADVILEAAGRPTAPLP